MSRVEITARMQKGKAAVAVDQFGSYRDLTIRGASVALKDGWLYQADDTQYELIVHMDTAQKDPNFKENK